MDRIDWENPISDHPLNQGLVSWWLVGEENPYWGGPLFRDLCNRNNGTLINGPTWRGAGGRPGGWGSLYFDGVNDYVVAATPSSLTSGWTISVWVWVDSSTTDGFHEILNFDLGHLLTIYKSGSSAIVRYYDGGSYDTGYVLSLNRWHHILVTHGTGQNLQIWVDGIRQVNAAKAFVMLNRLTSIGQGADAARYWTGYLDDVRIASMYTPDGMVQYLNSRQGYPGLLNRLPRRRYAPEQAVAGGLSIPIAAYHYNHHLGSMG